jgi:hypothetical protein
MRSAALIVVAMLTGVTMSSAEYPTPKSGEVVITSWYPYSEFRTSAGKLEILEKTICSRSDHQGRSYLARCHPAAKWFSRDFVDPDTLTPEERKQISPVTFSKFTEEEMARLNAYRYITIQNDKRFWGLWWVGQDLRFDGQKIDTGGVKVSMIYSAYFVENGVLCSITSTLNKGQDHPAEAMFINLKEKKAYFSTLGLKIGPLGFYFVPLD